jgi:hypothetical protein
MGRVRILVLIAACFAAGPTLAQETCRCSGVSFDWAGCDTNATCDAGAWTDCVPSPDDGYWIGSGCSVRVDQHDVLLAQGPAERLTIASGGSLTVRGPSELRLGEGGLSANLGSRVDLGGCFRRFTSEGEDCSLELDDAALFPIGRVLPCRDGDCAGDAHVVRLDWSGATGTLAAGVDSLLARTEPGRDALCFWQTSEAGVVGADAGYCYAIGAVGRSSGERFLEFDVRQVWATESDQAGAPLTSRVVTQATFAEAAPAGTRRLRFADGSLVDGTNAPIGRYLRCGDGTHPHLIASGEDLPDGDRLLLADPRGLAAPVAAGEVCHLDWGWTEWDAAFVMAPVHVTAATPTTGLTQLRLDGTTSLRAVAIDGIGGNGTYGPGSGVRIRYGPLEALEHVWVVDPLVMDTAAVLIDDVACGASIRHLVVTGGPPEAEHDQNYGLAWFGGPTCAYRVEHLYTRWMGDDNFVLESTGADPVGAIELRWVHAGPSSVPGDSGQLFDFGAPNPTTVSVRDAFCTGCTSPDGYGSLVAPASGPGLVEDLLWVGVRNGGLQFGDAASDNPSFAFRRFGIVGSAVDAANERGSGPLAGVVGEDFYVRDVSDPRPTSPQLCTGSPYGARTRHLARGVFLDVELGAIPCEPAIASLQDLYFVDVRHGGSGYAVVSVPRWSTQATLSRVTMAFRETSGALDFAFASAWPEPAPAITIDGLLISGFRGPSAIQAMVFGSAANAAAATWGAPSCFHDVVRVDSTASLAAYGTVPIVGVDPDFVDADGDRFDLSASSALADVGCGAREGGVSVANWAHRKAKIAPTYIGESVPSCGLGFEAGIALVAIERLLSRGSRAASRRARGCPRGARAA